VANDGGDDGADEGLVQTVASLTADLDGAAVVADSNWGRDSFWLMSFRVLGGWRGDGGAAVLRAFFYRCWEYFWFNFYVEHSIMFCMYVVDTKCK
jgi:hypothetical protein